jgi:Fur family transcriptional regulator, stress-responsive regulator
VPGSATPVDVNETARPPARVAQGHHHVVCRSCGSVADIACVAGAIPRLESADTAGFVIDQADVTFWGLCRDCQPRRPENAAP